MEAKKYCMFIHEGQNHTQTIESDDPFLSLNVGDEFGYGPNLQTSGKIVRVRHAVGLYGDTNKIRHTIDVYCE